MVPTAGIVYMALVGWHILPSRFPASAPAQAFPAAPVSVGDRYDVSVIHIRRQGDAPIFPSTDRAFRAGDIILLTGIISNAAATVLVVPIAIGTAYNLGANPQTFVMGTVIAPTTAFLMPIGHQANVLVFGPGGYRFTDYSKVGVWLNLIILVVLVALFLPLIWPFYP